MNYRVIKSLRLKRNLSERRLSEISGLSRSNIRKIEYGALGIRLENLRVLCQSLDRQLEVMVTPTEPVEVAHSVVYLSIQIERDGFESWKIHLMDFVDNFRRRYDPRLLVLPPVETLDARIKALITSTVLFLCTEVGADFPSWAYRDHFLSKPWFVSGMESLKASAILESPWQYRKNNIFVLSNFLARV